MSSLYIYVTLCLNAPLHRPCILKNPPTQMSTSPEALRNRKPPELNAVPPAAPLAIKKPKRPTDDYDDEIPSGISFVDILRVISSLLALSCVFSYFITDGESLAWGYRPRVTRWRTFKSIFKPAVNLTDAELSRYNGEDLTKPIYVAVNGSVFDVSANPGMYGPGGGYHFFAGRDAARAFVSGCFRDDLTWDMRGLERMYIIGKSREEDDRELAEIEELETAKKEGRFGDGLGKHEKIKKEGRLRWLKGRREKRRQEAWQKVKTQVDHWDKFFQGARPLFLHGEGCA